MSIHNIDGRVAAFFLHHWPANWGYVEFIRVGLDTSAYVRIHWLIKPSWARPPGTLGRVVRVATRGIALLALYLIAVVVVATLAHAVMS